MSTLKADTIQNTSGGAATLTKQMTAKLWATYRYRFDRSVVYSFNVSSVTDDKTGGFGVNATSSMSDARLLCMWNLRLSPYIK